MLIHLIIFRITDVLPTMVCLIVDLPTAILPNVCLRNYLSLLVKPSGLGGGTVGKLALDEQSW